jgi:hypothetical protein
VWGVRSHARAVKGSPPPQEEALKTTIDGINGDSLLSALPTIISDLKGIDTAWTALQKQIDQDCG